MAKLKLQQKLGLGAFKQLSDQLKTSGVHVVHGDPTKLAAVKQEHVVAKVVSAFNLGKKIEVNTSTEASWGKYKFAQLDGVFYLFRDHDE